MKTHWLQISHDKMLLTIDSSVGYYILIAASSQLALSQVSLGFSVHGLVVRTSARQPSSLRTCPLYVRFNSSSVSHWCQMIWCGLDPAGGGGNSHIKVTGVLAELFFVQTSKKCQDLVLWAWPKLLLQTGAKINHNT